MHKDNIDLSHFVKAHKHTYSSALKEIRNGRKKSHWMWYIFPQVEGLGYSEISKTYAIHNIEEAAAFLNDSYLGNNLIEISHTLLELNTNNATEVLGTPDDLKLKSSMTLFSLVPDADPVFQKVLDKFYDGQKDNKTLELLGLE